MTDFAAAKGQLEAQLTELKLRQERITEDLAEPLNADSAEQAVEVQDDVPLEQQATLIASQIGSVNRALARIENGSYGICVLCGGEISPRRLEVRPEASLCIECACREQ